MNNYKDILKKYGPKRKANNTTQNIKGNITVIDEDEVKNKITKKVIQPVEKEEIQKFSEEEIDEKPTYFLADGVTNISEDIVAKQLSHKALWVPIADETNPNNNQLPIENSDSSIKNILNPDNPTPFSEIRHRHDSGTEDSEDEHVKECANKLSELNDKTQNGAPIQIKLDTDLSPPRRHSKIEHEEFVTIKKPENGKQNLREESKSRTNSTKETFLLAHSENPLEAITTGIKQMHDKRKKLMEDFELSQKPLARYRDDPELEESLKSRQRSGDPLFNPQTTELITNPDESVKTTHLSMNRFNIHPGPKWDGIDRSNGFEKRRYNRIKEVQNQNQEAFMWLAEEI